MSVTEWKLEKAAKTCQTCARHFTPGEGFFSALYLEGEVFQRRNFCPTCWASVAEPYSFWRTRAPEPKERKREDRAALLAFFERLMDSPREGTEGKVAFVLSLLLLRKRVLRLKHRVVRDGGGETLLLERCSDGRSYAVEDPGLGEADLSQIGADMSKLLEVDFQL